MEGAPNDGTSADPAMTPIERQMQAIAPAFKTLLERRLVRIKSYGRPSGRGPKTPMTTTNLLRAEETGRTTRKLTAIKSLVVGAAKLKGLRPGAGTEQKAQEVPLHPINVRQQKQPGRPNNQNDKISHSSSLSDKTDETIHLDNSIVQPNPQEIRMTKRHVWRKNCGK